MIRDRPVRSPGGALRNFCSFAAQQILGHCAAGFSRLKGKASNMHGTQPPAFAGHRSSCRQGVRRSATDYVKKMQDSKTRAGTATVNFMRNFRALSKSVEFHPCASAQGRDSKEDAAARGADWGREDIRQRVVCARDDVCAGRQVPVSAPCGAGGGGARLRDARLAACKDGGVSVAEAAPRGP